jgi:hypothetical protein
MGICSISASTVGGLKAILAERQSLVKKEWLKSSEVRNMLGISHITLQNLRTNGLLPHSKLGGIYSI